MKFIRIWKRLAVMSFQVQASHPLSSSGYLLGKFIRLVFFLIFLSAIFRHTRALAGYTLAEAALFFLTFNLVDILAQLIFRGIYGIRGLIREGDFDYFLIQPLPVLFRVMFNNVDFLDVITIIPVIGMIGWIADSLPGGLDGAGLVWYALLVGNGVLIAMAIHMAVASLAVWTQELENTIWIYRDLMTLGRFPADIYRGPMKAVLRFVIPIAVMITFPVKALLGSLSDGGILHSCILTALLVLAAFQFWQIALKHYTSVSS